MVDGALYHIELRNMNSGQHLVFDMATNNLARFVREWNKDNPMKVWQVTSMKYPIRMEIYEERKI